MQALLMPKLSKTLTLHVTAERIARAQPGCSTCPIALALSDRGFGATVGHKSATVSLTDGAFAEYWLPPFARTVAILVDMGFSIPPVSFRITRMH